MGSKYLKKRWQKILFIAVLVFFVFISIPAYFVNRYWSPILAEKVKTTITNSTDSLYSVSFASASLHVLEGKLVIDQIVLTPNMAVYNRRKKQHLAPNSLYSLRIKRLVIHHVHPWMLYFEDKLDVHQIVVSEPNLKVDYEQNRDQDTVITGKKTPYQWISKVLKSIHVESIVLNDVTFKYTDHSSKKPANLDITDLSFSATDFLLDSVSQFDTKRFLFCADLSSELNNYGGVTHDNRYKYKINTIRFSTRSQQLEMLGLSLIPATTHEEFFKSTPSDCFALKLDSLRLYNFDFKLYSKYHKVFASNLTLSNGSIEVFDNPGPNDSTTDRSANFPHVMLRTLKPELKIDTIQINRIGAFYTETGVKSGEDGTVSFNNISGQFFNVTNNKEAVAKNNITTAKLQTYFMNRGKLDLQLAFNLTDPQAQFKYKGHMGMMDLKKVTPVSMPLALVKIASGKLNSLDFDMTADKRSARGSIVALYHDLKISVMKKDEKDQKLKTMSIMSLFANTLVIKRNNPNDGQAARTYSGVYIRKKTSTIFTYIYKSLFVGLKTIAGYDVETERTVKKKMSDMQNGKADRIARKAARLQRREERKQMKEQRRQQKELDKQLLQQSQ